MHISDGEGVAEAQNNVGHMYEKGLGVTQNYAMAMQWYRRAAEQDLSEAKLSINFFITMDMGATNYREAVSWFRAAAGELPETGTC